MSNLNDLTNKYFKNNKRFADVVNFMVFGGEPVIKAEEHFEDYATFDTETGEMIKRLTDIPVTIDKEGAHMCNAMKEIVEESRMEGIKYSIKALMETMHLSVEQAMDALRIPQSEQKKYDITEQ